MKNLIYAEDSPKRFKVGDNDTNITIVPIEITDSVNTLVKMDKNANARVLIRNKNTYITSITPVITDSVAVISSKKLVKMPAGEYFLELWVTTDGGTVVYPDRGFLPLFINENAEGETGEPITNVNADALRDELKQWVAEQLKTIHGSDIDLSNYFTKDEVTKLVDNSKVDLTPYLKTVDADNKYLVKGTIVLDTNGRTLTVGDNTINIPNAVDLGEYAKTDRVPNITYNSGTNTINLNGTDIKLSSNVDLSDYYTKGEIDSKLSNSSANVNLDDITNKLGITQFNTNFSPTLDDGVVVSNLNVYAGNIDLSSSASKYEYLTLVKNGTTDVNPGPTADDLDNAQDITDLTGVTLLNGYRWFTILSGKGFKDIEDFVFGSAWFFSSSLPYLSIRVIAYDTTSKKYVAVNKAGAGERLVRLLPLTSQISEGDFNSGTKVRMYAAKDNIWLVKDLVYKTYKNNSNLTDILVGLPFYQVINLMMTGNTDPQGSTNLVTFNGKDNPSDQVENNAPVTFFLTNLGGGEMKFGDQPLNPSTALVYQYPDKNTGQYELPIKLSSDSKSWLISCYKGRHLVPFLKQVDSDGQLRPINNTVDAFEPVYNGGPTNTQTEITLYPFGIEPVHITFTK